MCSEIDLIPDALSFLIGHQPKDNGCSLGLEMSLVHFMNTLTFLWRQQMVQLPNTNTLGEFFVDVGQSERQRVLSWVNV